MELQRVGTMARQEYPERTAYWGDVTATQRLIRRCFTKPGELVLNLGCGTGETACLLAEQFGLRVVVVDDDCAALELARERIELAGLTEQITIVQMDLRALEFAAATFDAVIAETDLIAGGKAQALAEAFRVLKRGRYFGTSDLTLLECPPSGWRMPVSRTYSGVEFRPLLGEEWFSLLERAGFRDVSATIAPLRPSPQFADDQPDYAGSGLRDSGGYNSFRSRDRAQTWNPYAPYLGFGLYVGRKLERFAQT